ncbi:hypothetical protein D1505_25800 [Escherichia coli]|uniref:hypothetical protein n=1 Tax=Escherichia coli TaxID=562 RepID=UPI000BD0317F|nr:hypothetical protein D1505_25800 [Escherichia coli]RIX51136.1 hypothetical protein D3I61_26390 [Escherichia coli]
MGSCAAPSAKGDDKFITTDYLQQCQKPWASLVGRLQHPELQVQPFDEKVARHKARKYGRVDNVEVWGHRDSKFKYLMVINDDNKKRVLVTVFERNE